MVPGIIARGRNLCSFIRIGDNRLRRSRAPWFILANLLLTYVATVLAALLWMPFEKVPGNNGPTFPNGGWVYEFVFVCVIGPLLETFIFQWGIIRLMQRSGWFATWAMVLVSAIFFGASHWYDMSYVFFATCLGLVLAYAFVACDGTSKNAYWCVVAIHALRNLATFILLLSVR